MTDNKRHSPLPPSSAARWIACPPSALKNAEIEDQPTEAALEGTDAHSLCEYKVKTALGENAENPIENLDFYNAEMEEYTDGYLSYSRSRIRSIIPCYNLFKGNPLSPVFSYLNIINSLNNQ